MLQLVFAAFRPHLSDRDTRCIVDHQSGFTDHAGALDQLAPFVIFQVSGSQMLGIYFRLHREQTVHQLLPRHLETENRNGFVFLKRHILRNIEDKRRFTHRRTCRNQDKVRVLQTRCLVVQIRESGRNTRDISLRLRCTLNVLQRIDDNLADRHEVSGIPLAQ